MRLVDLQIRELWNCFRQKNWGQKNQKEIGAERNQSGDESPHSKDPYDQPLADCGLLGLLA